MTRAATGKQARYLASSGRDWIDECADTMEPVEFRAAMRFTIGKYVRRAGKKDDLEKEIEKIRDYAERWLAYERGISAPEAEKDVAMLSP